MEEILLSLQSQRLSVEESLLHPVPFSSNDATARSTACAAFARALRHVAVHIPAPADINSPARKDAHEASADLPPLSSPGSTAEWLYNLCCTIPSPLDILALSQAVLSACQYSDEGQIQAALFDALGEGERAMEVLFEIVPRASDIRRLEERLLRLVANRNKDCGASLAQDSEMERLRLLREAAEESAHYAAWTKAQAEVSSNKPGLVAGTHVVVRSSDKEAQKIAKKAAKQAAAALALAKEAGAIIDNEGSGFDAASLAAEAENDGRRVGLDGMTREQLWEMQANLLPEGTKQYYQEKGLPKGTERKYGDGYEIVTIPAPVLDTSKLHPRIVLADAMNDTERVAFTGTNLLNPMQSSVFDAAFHTNDNLLICAPTGAGKTNVAMLAVVAHLRDKGIIKNDNDPHVAYQHIAPNGGGGGVNAASFVGGRKIIYIAPMKALAQEVVEKFSSKLKALNVVVRELTGDMQLTRAEADRADVIVTTPEKWDVITRKGGDGSLGQTCGLLIIDEVHLLADERGAVIESVVARLHRLVESTQKQVRIVGLSATLPNYEDVATFLRVDKSRGLFFFGPEHRPVPLQQQFVGVADIKDRFRRENKMNDVCYEIVSDSLRRGYQVMVFVHSRRGTGDTARALTERATKAGELDQLFITMGSEKNGDAHTRYSDRAIKSRNRELTEHFNNGIGIHHAGMLRGDRKLTEQMFADGAIKVLCCTATLAWGINLPAHTVVIKGTEVYSAEKGGSIDLSILDVMQIFGRAGRPQFDTSGEATLITSHDGLARYLDKLVRAVPIESNFVKQIADHLNAEVVGGTVTTISEASEWLAYTYLHVRMCKNPLAYGINSDQRDDDPMLRGRSMELVKDAAKLLDGHRMIRYDIDSGNLAVTDLGRVASHFYIRAESVATFNDMLGRLDNPTDADLCHMICCAYEFENVKVRAEEMDEIDELKKKQCPLLVKAPVEEFSGKCCVLMQSFISNARIKSFTLISDTNYIASNAGRVARALFEMCLKRGMAGASLKLLRIAKSVDKRLWWFQTPLRQFEGEKIPPNTFKALESRTGASRGTSGYDSFEFALSLLDMQPSEVGQLCHNFRGGEHIQRLVKFLPKVEMSCRVQPVTRDVLRFQIQLVPAFEWHGRWHGGAEGFWLWVEDGGNNRIYHHEHILFNRRTHTEPMNLEVTIPAFDPLPPQYFLRLVSDSWVSCEMLLPVSFRHVLLPKQHMPYTDLFDLTPLPKSALQYPSFEQLYSGFETFNPIQTQLFHTLYHTDSPVLLGAPTGSGKTIVAEIAVLRMKKQNPSAKCVYIAPLKSLARERLKEWNQRFGASSLGWKVLELSGDTHHDRRTLNQADLLICTPEKWDLVSRGWRCTDVGSPANSVNDGNRFIKNVRLLIIDEIHLLGEERGAVLEAIVSRTRFISKFADSEEKTQHKSSSANVVTKEKLYERTRIVGLSTAIANPYDLADWIGIDVTGHDVSAKRGLYNFRPSVRPIPMEVHIQGYPGKHYCPRMATMNKPCYAAIKEHSPEKPVIIFVASRRQTRLTALDLISYAASDENPRGFLGCSDDYMEMVSSTLNDAALRHTITFGIGLHHAGITSHDRETVEKLFLGGEIRVLVATATLAWGVNLPAHLVIVKGTEYFDGKSSRYVDYPVTDVLQMMGRAGRPQFDTQGVACVMVAEEKKNFYKKFLYSPFPVESCLGLRLPENLNAEVSVGTINSVHDAVGYLSWTFFSRRVKINPSFYGAEETTDEGFDKFFLKTVTDGLLRLKESGCVDLTLDNGKVWSDSEVKPTILGRTSCNFYLQHETPIQMRDGLQKARDSVTKVQASQGMEFVATSDGTPIIFLFSEEVEMAGIATILFTLSQTHEFDELPVRHNEEYLNAELSEALPWGPDTLAAVGRSRESSRRKADNTSAMSDPHTKCFLLLQAHIARAKLPVSDYVNDTKSVLDQIPRLLAAMQFIALDDRGTSGNFDLMCIFSLVRRCLSSRTMIGTSHIQELLGLTKDGLKHLMRQGIKGIEQLRLESFTAAVQAEKATFPSEQRSQDNKLIRSDRLSTILFVCAEKFVVIHETKKETGESVGRISFDLFLPAAVLTGYHHRDGKTASSTKSEFSLAIVLGSSAHGNFLLGYKSIYLSFLAHQERESTWRKSIEVQFDWAFANAHAESNCIILRLLCEDVRGADLQYYVPLK